MEFARSRPHNNSDGYRHVSISMITGPFEEIEICVTALGNLSLAPISWRFFSVEDADMMPLAYAANSSQRLPADDEQPVAGFLIELFPCTLLGAASWNTRSTPSRV